MTSTRNVPTECLLNNIIDEDFQAMMFPLNLFQLFFLTAKFNVSNNFITPKTNISNYLTAAVGAIMLVLSFVFRFFYYYKAFENFASPFVRLYFCFDVVFYSIVSVVTHIVAACYSGSTVELIIKLQSILNSMKIDKRRFLLKVKIQNWISILLLVGVYTIYFLPIYDNPYSSSPFFVVNKIILVVPTLILDLQIVIVTRIVVLIKNELVAWNHIMERYKRQIKTENEVEAEDPAVNMFDAYVDMVRSFQLCNKVHKLVYTLIGFHTFLQILSNLQVVLDFAKTPRAAGFFQSIQMRLLTGIWNLKNLVILIFLSIACEDFYGTVRTADATCANILSNHDVYRGMRRTCKNVLRLRRAALRKLSACGICELDATLPLRMLAALLAYTVVLLQFEFL